MKHFNRRLSRLSLAVLAFGVLNGGIALAAECANSGTAYMTDPNDNNSHLNTACGDNARATFQGSTAVGANAYANSNFATAFGYNSFATGSDVALGPDTWANGGFSVGIGKQVRAAGNLGVAIGLEAELTAAADRSIVIGPYAFTDQPDTMVLGGVKGINGASSYVDIGNGTYTPLVPLHIFRDDGTAQLLVEETSLDAVPRTLFRLASAGSNAKFEIDNTMAGVSWAFTNSGNDFRVSRQGSGEIEFLVTNNGDAYVSGLIFENSDRHAKTAIETVDSEAILEKVLRLPIAEWAYRESPESRHVGPMAQDFHATFGTGTSDTRLATMDGVGVAIASIQGLEKRNRALQGQVVALREELDEIKELVRTLLVEPVSP